MNSYFRISRPKTAISIDFVGTSDILSVQSVFFY